ncbi:MAG: DNA adenine methylase [bacterium]
MVDTKDYKPFVKWVGGKTQLIKTIAKFLPKDFAELEDVTYVEPFVGGGAMLFWMLHNYQNISRAVINDINPVLTNAYSVVKEKPLLLIEFLLQIEELYFSLENEGERKNYFLLQREKFNHYSLDSVQQAGLFIFLNRTCFNGLYRVNKRGFFNVPFGKYSKPKICDTQTILADSEALQKVEILTGDFSKTIDYATKETLFYFDPPYKPISKTSSFTTYTKEDFDDLDQLRLGEFCKNISELGHRFLLSNSDVKNVNPIDNFFDDLYKMFDIERVTASRMINSNASNRGKIAEILVSNTQKNIYTYE